MREADHQAGQVSSAGVAGVVGDAEPGVPREALGPLFLRFLRFGLLAWGGPVAQIAMIRQELVERDRWISSGRFNRVLAVYQALPGPEAHELCVYFGSVARGRLGGLVAGLGFMLPGLVFMLALSWMYVSVGLSSPWFAAAFKGCQPAVTALIIRAVHRLGSHAVTTPFLWVLAIAACLGQLLGVHFLPMLALSGAAYSLHRSGSPRWAIVPLAVVIGLLAAAAFMPSALPGFDVGERASSEAASEPPSAPALFVSGLRAGLLTFGGAYTVIPFLERDAVEVGGWLTQQEFLDGIALSGVIPAPLVIFSTFVGFVASDAKGGSALLGALCMTAGVFLPAFGFTLIGHRHIERLVETRPLHSFLDGVTAGVIGIIGATAIRLIPATVSDTATAAILAGALVALYRFKARWTIPAVVIGAALAGILVFRPSS